MEESHLSNQSIISPQLSIIIPFYQKKEMIGEMIDSILANSFRNWELLAIDDGASTDTLQYLSKYTDERIRIIKRNRLPKGAQTCRNIGLDMAQGEYIVFFDSDDYIAEYCLMNRIKTMEAHKDIDFMVFPSGEYRNNHFHVQSSKALGYHIYKDDMAAFLNRTLPFAVWTNIYRTASLRSASLRWDENIASFQDSDFNIQALLHGLKYDYADSEPDYGYRIDDNPETISKKIISEEHQNSHLYFLDKEYKTVKDSQGKLYDTNLFLCALHIYNLVMSNGVISDYADSLANIVNKYDRMRGRLLHLMIAFSTLLARIFPDKISRQIPMLPYLIWKYRQERHICKRITKITG